MILKNLQREAQLLRRHMKVLRVLKRKGPLGIRRISEETGIPPHQVRYSLRVLEREGALVPTPKGARLTDAVDTYIANLVQELGDLESLLAEVSKAARDLQSS